MFDTPILFLIFNRPDTTQKVFEQIRAVKPKYLFIAADGARVNNESDKIRCAETRQIVTLIDWDCDVKTLFRDENLGCKNAPKSGIDWFFSNVEAGIILEDDCVPSLDFFYFCQQTLDLYKNDNSIFLISGTNHLFLNKKKHYPFYFSKISATWGWATWAKKWKLIDWDDSALLISRQTVESYYSNIFFSNYIFQMAKQQKENKITAWDIYVVLTIIKNNFLSIAPSQNLICNIGNVGTHASKSDNSPFVGMKTGKLNITDIKYQNVIYSNEFDKLAMKNIESYSKKQNKKTVSLQKLILEKTYSFLKFFVLLMPNQVNSLIRVLKNMLGDRSQTSTLLLYNVFKKTYKKKALLSYLIKPFIQNDNLSHTNSRESYLLAKILDDLGYIVDVIDYDIKANNINFNEYDIILGQGEALEQSIIENSKSKKILYSPGCSQNYNHIESINVLKRFYTRNNLLISKECRFAKQNWVLQQNFSDQYIVLGNRFVSDTYINQGISKNRILNVNIFYHDIGQIDLNRKDFTKTQKCFLWFGGTGAIHKGLDIVIEYFAKHKELDLYICGHLSGNFYDFYKDNIENNNNIHYKSFVHIKSDEFYKIVMSCSALIYPSISEGGAASIISVLAFGGLIPIITKSSGLDLNEHCIIMSESSITEIDNGIKKYLEIPVNKQKSICTDLRNEIRNKHTETNFINSITELLKQ